MNTFYPPAVGKRWTVALLLMAGWLSLAPFEQSQAQLYIDIYPSQDNYRTQTLWVLSGSSQASVFIDSVGPYITHGAHATAEQSNNRDTYELEDLLYAGPRGIGISFLANPRLFDLTALSTSSLDYAGVTNFWAATNTVSSLASAAGTATLSFDDNGAVTNRSISHMLLYGQPSGNDWLGPRVSGGSNLTYGTNRPTVNWVGAGVLSKPIGDFLSRRPYIRNKAQVVGYFGANTLGRRPAHSRAFRNRSRTKGIRPALWHFCFGLRRPPPPLPKQTPTRQLASQRACGLASAALGLCFIPGFGSAFAGRVLPRVCPCADENQAHACRFEALP